MPIVVDSITRSPLPNASIFNKKGVMVGLTNSKGGIYGMSSNDYPLTIRYLGFKECQIVSSDVDTILLVENIAELPSVVVESGEKKMLHILAYMREYSTLSSYTDTITMFREKMVDYMVPGDKNKRHKGWRNPRVLNARSYYQFTDDQGLDSVSDKCGYHFTWSDWIGLLPAFSLPDGMVSKPLATDTVYGKYSPTEIWTRNKDRLSLYIDVLADTTSRRWVPGISSFFKERAIDFGQLKIRFNYDDVISDKVRPLDLVSYSFNIDSRGRGHNMFRFNRRDQPFFVTTYTEVYILDKEYISMREAKDWETRSFDVSQIEIFEPADAPELQPNIMSLIERVSQIDEDKIRLDSKTDKWLMVRKVRKENYLKKRALGLLRKLTGIAL